MVLGVTQPESTQGILPLDSVITQQSNPATVSITKFSTVLGNNSQMVIANAETLLTEISCKLTCPKCHNVIATETKPVPGKQTYVASFILCISGQVICNIALNQT